MTGSDKPPDDEDARRRQNYERRIVVTVLLVLFSVLGGASVLVQNTFGSFHLPSLPDMSFTTPFSALPPRDPAINIYHQPGLPEATANGVVTTIVSREDRMPAGGTRLNYYARTEYYLPRYDSNCYFHHYLGPDEPRFKKGQGVTVAYQPQAFDPCGSSRIIE